MGRHVQFALALVWLAACDEGAEPPPSVETQALGTTSTPGVAVWQRAISTDGTANAVARKIASDPHGNELVAGEFHVKIDFLDGSGAHVGDDAHLDLDAFVAKYDAYGSFRWAALYTSGKWDEIRALASDAGSHVLVLGAEHGEDDFGHFTGGQGDLGCDPTGGNPWFLEKLSPTGSCVWARGFHAPTEIVSAIFEARMLDIAGMAVDAAGDIVLAGRYGNWVDFGDGVILNTTGYPDETFDHDDTIIWTPFVAVLDPDGHALWAKRLDGKVRGAIEDVTGLGVDGAGDLVLTGTTGTGASFVLALDPRARVRWRRTLDAQIESLSVDAAGHVAIGGAFTGTVDIGNTTYHAGSKVDLFAVKYDSGGDAMWQKHVGGTAQKSLAAVNLDRYANVEMGLNAQEGTLKIGPNTWDATGGTYLAKFSPTYGTTIWAKEYLGPHLADLTSTPSGRILLTGDSAVGADFGKGPMPDDADLFVVRMYP